MTVSLALKGAAVTAGSVVLVQGFCRMNGFKSPITAQLQALTTAVAFIATSIFWSCSEFKSTSEAYLAAFIVCGITKLSALVIADPDGKTIRQFVVAGLAQLIVTCIFNLRENSIS